MKCSSKLKMFDWHTSFSVSHRIVYQVDNVGSGQRWPRAILTVRNVYLYIQYIYRYKFFTVRIVRDQRWLRVQLRHLWLQRQRYSKLLPHQLANAGGDSAFFLYFSSTLSMMYTSSSFSSSSSSTSLLRS